MSDKKINQIPADQVDLDGNDMIPVGRFGAAAARTTSVDKLGEYILEQTTEELRSCVKVEDMDVYDVEGSTTPGTLSDSDTSFPSSKLVKGELAKISAKVVELVGTEDTTIDLSSLVEHLGVISSSNVWAKTTDKKYTHVVLAVKKGETYRITAQDDKLAYYALLSSHSSLLEGDSPSFSDGARNKIERGASVDVCIPQDSTCEYIYITKNGNSPTTIGLPTVWELGKVGAIAEIRGDVSGNSSDIEDIDARVSSLEAFDTKRQIQATSYDTQVRMREQSLRSDYAKGGQTPHWYGVRWSETTNANNVTAIYSDGDANLHSSLPIQSLMRRCVVKNGIVQYYLGASNSNMKDDGTTANLDGTDGNVMVEIPEFFYRHDIVIDGGISYHCLKLSLQGLPGFHYMAKRYVSAYNATIDRTTNILASVSTMQFKHEDKEVKTTTEGGYIVGTSYSKGIKHTAERVGFSQNAQNYRGASNNSAYDDLPQSSSDYGRCQLGLPICKVKRSELRGKVDVDNAMFIHQYDSFRALWMLNIVEFKHRNAQLTSLGMGSSTYPNYTAQLNYFLPTGGAACVPCGVTNSLGNTSGEVYYKMVNVPIDNDMTSFADVWMPVMSYRGVEQFWGQLYTILDQISVKLEHTNTYASGHEGESAWEYVKVSYYYTANPYLASDNEDNKIGEYTFLCDTKVYSKLVLGEYMHVIPTDVTFDGNETDRTKNYCDCVEFMKFNGVGYMMVNGRAVSGTLNGRAFFNMWSHELSPFASSGARFDYIGI